MADLDEDKVARLLQVSIAVGTELLPVENPLQTVSSFMDVYTHLRLALRIIRSFLSRCSGLFSSLRGKCHLVSAAYIA